MGVRVYDFAPRSLWSRPESHTGTETRRSKKARLSCRVPVVRALRLMWQLPLEVLVQGAAKELWEWSEMLELWGSVFEASLESVVWPQMLKQLVLNTKIAVATETIPWPPFRGPPLWNA